MSRQRKPGTFTVMKDVASYIGGWALIAHQALVVKPADFNWWFLVTGGLLVGVPGFSQLLAMRTGGGPSPSPEQVSPPPPSPSPNASAAER
jgi:hypothetical protein